MISDMLLMYVGARGLGVRLGCRMEGTMITYQWMSGSIYCGVADSGVLFFDRPSD